jgi:hypothetical protein
MNRVAVSRRRSNRSQHHTHLNFPHRHERVRDPAPESRDRGISERRVEGTSANDEGPVLAVANPAPIALLGARSATTKVAQISGMYVRQLAGTRMCRYALPTEESQRAFGTPFCARTACARPSGRSGTVATRLEVRQCVMVIPLAFGTRCPVD